MSGTDSLPTSGLQLRSLITPEGRLELSLVDTPVSPLRDDEVLIRVEATPINPSDLGLLTGPADLSQLTAGGGDSPTLTAPVPERALAMVKARLGESMPVGNEGAGTVIAAGGAPAAQALVGKRVAALGGSMYAQYKTARAGDVLELPADATAADGASCFVNPLTALGMVETMRAEGHTALVHTAAASNLGQMLNRICLADGVPLVCVVRSAEQTALLQGQGAQHVVDTSQPDFVARLVEAISATGATLGFDAIGGGRLASQILGAMETAINNRGGAYSRYGSSVHKQVYLYGALDTGPTELVRSYGMAWGVGGWLLTPFLIKAGAEKTAALKARVAAELKTTFASHYTQEISLREALDPQVLAAYSRRATGEKYLINPSR